MFTRSAERCFLRPKIQKRPSGVAAKGRRNDEEEVIIYEWVSVDEARSILQEQNDGSWLIREDEDGGLHLHLQCKEIKKMSENFFTNIIPLKV